MSKRLLVLLAHILLLANCNPTSASPTQPVIATLSPTVAPLPTITAIPTSTAYPPLNTQGPYLLIARDNQHITIFDADAGGRKEIQLPNSGYTFLDRAVSPDGQWLIYFTGTTKPSFDVTLNLLNLSDGRTQEISALLAPGFPENLEPLLQAMELGDPARYDTDCFADLACRRSLIEREITSSIFAFDWAPDGRSVAFVAQRESPSSNIYVYQLSDNSTQKLTNEPENIHTLVWAPNGQSIIYKVSAAPGLGFEGSQWHLMDRNGTSIPFSSGLSSTYFDWGQNGWLTENLYLMLRHTDVDPAFSNFILLNTDTGQIKEVWRDHAYSFAVDREHQTIALIHRDYESQPSTIPEGVYVVYPDGTNQKLSDIDNYLVLVEGPKQYPLLIEDYERRFQIIHADGSITPLPWTSIPRISPDGSLFLTMEEQKLTLYNSSQEALKSWTLIDRASISWSPDSGGIFLFEDVNVYYLSITSDEPTPLFDDCTLAYCPPSQYVWIP